MIVEAIEIHFMTEVAASIVILVNQEDLIKAIPNAIPILPPNLKTKVKISAIIAMSLALLQLIALNKMTQIRSTLSTSSSLLFQMTPLRLRHSQCLSVHY